MKQHVNVHVKFSFFKVFLSQNTKTKTKTGFAETNFIQFSLICFILKYYANGSNCVGDDYSTSVFPPSPVAHTLTRDFNGFQYAGNNFDGF